LENGKILFASLRLVVGHAYASLKKEIGVGSQLFLIKQFNSRTATRICSDTDLWSYIDEVRRLGKECDPDSSTVPLHVSMGSKQKDDAYWPVFANFDPANQNHIDHLWRNPDSYPGIGTASPETMTTNKNRRANLMTISFNVNESLRSWLTKILTTQDCFMYHSMSPQQYQVAEFFLGAKRVDLENQYIFQKFPLKENDPTSWPQSMRDIFGDAFRTLFTLDIGIPTKGTNPVDSNGYPVQLKHADPESIASNKLGKVLNLMMMSMLDKHKRLGDVPATETSPTTIRLTIKTEQFYKLHLLNGDQSATLLFKECEINHEEAETVFDFFTSRMNDAIMNVVSLTEQEQSKIDKGDSFQCVEIYENKELSSTILTVDAFQKLTLKELMSFVDCDKRELKIVFFKDKRSKINTWGNRKSL